MRLVNTKKMEDMAQGQKFIITCQRGTFEGPLCCFRSVSVRMRWSEINVLEKHSEMFLLWPWQKRTLQPDVDSEHWNQTGTRKEWAGRAGPSNWCVDISFRSQRGKELSSRKWVQILHSLYELRNNASVGFTVSSRSGNSQCRHHRAPGPLGPLPFLTAPWLWASCGWELWVARAPLVRGEELLLVLKAGPVAARPREGCRGLEAERPAEKRERKHVVTSLVKTSPTGYDLVTVLCAVFTVGSQKPSFTIQANAFRETPKKKTDIGS